MGERVICSVELTGYMQNVDLINKINNHLFFRHLLKRNGSSLITPQAPPLTALSIYYSLLQTQ